MMGGQDKGHDESRSTKIAVRVPQRLVDQIDATYEERGYTSRSEAIRDALRVWMHQRGPDEATGTAGGESSPERRQQEETGVLKELADSYGSDVYD